MESSTEQGRLPLTTAFWHYKQNRTLVLHISPVLVVSRRSFQCHAMLLGRHIAWQPNDCHGGDLEFGADQQLISTSERLSFGFCSMYQLEALLLLLALLLIYWSPYFVTLFPQKINLYAWVERRCNSTVPCWRRQQKDSDWLKLLTQTCKSFKHCTFLFSKLRLNSSTENWPGKCQKKQDSPAVSHMLLLTCS